MIYDLLIRTITGRADEAEVVAVRAWRRQSPANERQYVEVARALELLHAAEDARQAPAPPSATSIIAAARSTGRNSDYFDSLPKIGRYSLAAALVLLVASGLLLAQLQSARPAFGAQEVVTGPSEHSTIVLNDGSVVRLAGSSSIAVRESRRSREVTIDGRAFFAVAHDPSKPFVVRAGASDVRAIGTRFTVEASEDLLRVVVIEGSVAVGSGDEAEEIQLHTGQVASLASGERPLVDEVAHPEALTSWVGDFIALQNTPLSAAAEEIEALYGVDVVLTSPVLEDRTITAWFSGWTIEAVLEVVCMVAYADCRQTGTTVVISPKSSQQIPQ